MKFQASKDVSTGGGNYLEAPGTYHFVVMQAEEHPRNKDGELMDGLRVTLCAVEGTTRDADGNFSEREKTVSLTFFNPAMTQKNEGAFNHKKQTRLMIALGLMNDSELGSEVDIDFENSRGRQVIAEVEKDDDNPKYLRLSFSNIWHFDDPYANKCPRCEATAKHIRAEWRRQPSTFTDPRKSASPATASKPQTSFDLDQI